MSALQHTAEGVYGCEGRIYLVILIQVK